MLAPNSAQEQVSASAILDDCCLISARLAHVWDPGVSVAAILAQALNLVQSARVLRVKRSNHEFREFNEWITNDSWQIRVIREIRGYSFDNH